MGLVGLVVDGDYGWAVVTGGRWFRVGGDCGVGRGYEGSRGAKRSPWAVTRVRVSGAVKKRSWGWRQASTSSQVTGVETVGNWRARSEVRARVVLEPLF